MILEKGSETCEVFLVIRTRYTSNRRVLWTVTTSAHTHTNKTKQAVFAALKGLVTLRPELGITSHYAQFHCFSAKTSNSTADRFPTSHFLVPPSLPFKVKTKSLFKPSAPLCTLAQPQTRMMLYPAGSSFEDFEEVNASITSFSHKRCWWFTSRCPRRSPRDRQMIILQHSWHQWAFKFYLYVFILIDTCRIAIILCDQKIESDPD